jgi:hypothetical protein
MVGESIAGGLRATPEIGHARNAGMRTMRHGRSATPDRVVAQGRIDVFFCVQCSANLGKTVSESLNTVGKPCRR